MAEVTEQITKALEHFKQQRDELQVQLHLAKAEAKDEWARRCAEPGDRGIEERV